MLQIRNFRSFFINKSLLAGLPQSRETRESPAKIAEVPRNPRKSWRFKRNTVKTLANFVEFFLAGNEEYLFKSICFIFWIYFWFFRNFRQCFPRFLKNRSKICFSDHIFKKISSFSFKTFREVPRKSRENWKFLFISPAEVPRFFRDPTCGNPG